jgi:hypothetical protein
MARKRSKQIDDDSESARPNSGPESKPSAKLDPRTEECLSMLLVGVFGGVLAYRQILRLVGDVGVASIQQWGVPDYVLIAGTAVSLIVFPSLRVLRRVPINLIFLIAAILGLILGGIVVYMIAPSH